MDKAISSLTNQIIQAQKEKATNQVKDKIGKEINNLLGGDKKPKDSTSTSQEEVKENVKNALQGLFK
ncbi:hypothetical protein J9332_42555, partial [Aquimarina celericrescens]|nr:hypothetical protein [Aquimarina celericrescens]